MRPGGSIFPVSMLSIKGPVPIACPGDCFSVPSHSTDCSSQPPSSITLSIISLVRDCHLPVTMSGSHLFTTPHHHFQVVYHFPQARGGAGADEKSAAVRSPPSVSDRVIAAFWGDRVKLWFSRRSPLPPTCSTGLSLAWGPSGYFDTHGSTDGSRSQEVPGSQIASINRVVRELLQHGPVHMLRARTQ